MVDDFPATNIPAEPGSPLTECRIYYPEMVGKKDKQQSFQRGQGRITLKNIPVVDVGE